ncbi:SIR2 family protein [Oricola thermophila]|uniref:SIR2 family protein n=1 Tax=Oricola thermophila TaxID=2742145 RepID=A0A6N1VA11_9HYPH|nr:SIR2 family protein [Oricola thermophila]QKV17353.1 SIR2 family protein [Oricola thermophila]
MGNSNRKNVFIVGAGASKEFGLPTGPELTEIIRAISSVAARRDQIKTASKESLLYAIRRLAAERDPDKPDINGFYGAARIIANNMQLAPSIDNFLDTHRDNDYIVNLGKLLIAITIHGAERSSHLYVSGGNIYNTINTNDIKDTWIARLFGILVSQRDFHEFIKALDNITFISFNYDRCIEQFFLHASKSYFHLDSSKLNCVREALNVIHPYGSLGQLEWNHPIDTGFGADLHPAELVASSKKIKTFTEGADSEIISAIDESLAGSDLAIFLGFSFLPLNMKLLLQDKKYSFDRVIGTGKGLSNESRKIVTEEIASQMTEGSKERISIIDGTCSDLFYEHYRYLMK